MPRDRNAQPISAAPGQAYGERQRQEEGQAVAPMAGDPVQALEGIDLGLPGPADRPTERPDEPLTEGVPSGPGAGPEAIPDIDTLGAQDPDLMMLAAYLPMLEVLADRPDSTVAMRNMVRRLRAIIPPDFNFQNLFSGPQWGEATEDPDVYLDPDEYVE